MIKKGDYDKILSGNQGTIIKDFNSLLNFIEEKKSIALTKSETAFNMAEGLKLKKPVVLKKHGEAPIQYESENYFDDLEDFDDEE